MNIGLGKLKLQRVKSSAKRGDTIIEVMFAFTIFSMIAVMTVMVMNSGVASTERSLELVTVRNELNAQAEALRFIQSSYISELTLPECGAAVSGAPCQKYQELWNAIRNRAVSNVSIDYPPDFGTDGKNGCHEIYDKDPKPLQVNNAFIINPRKLPPSGSGSVSATTLKAAFTPYSELLFKKPLLNARILYKNSAGTIAEDVMQNANLLTNYTDISTVEGIWVIAERGADTRGLGYPDYYDFYIETCWNGTDTPIPTALDTIIRLYNTDKAT